MALTDLQRLRLLIQDPLRPAERNMQGDGRSPFFILPHQNLNMLEVSVLGTDTVEESTALLTGSQQNNGFDGISTTVLVRHYKTYDTIEFAFSNPGLGLAAPDLFALVPVSTLDAIADGDMASATFAMGSSISMFTVTGVSGDDVTFMVTDSELTFGTSVLNIRGIVEHRVDVDTTGWTDADVDSTDEAKGTVTLELPVKGLVRFVYEYSAFSDDELEDYIEQGEERHGDKLYGAALLVVDTLMFDGVRRKQWRAPDGTMVNDTAAQQHLQQMRDRFKKELSELAVMGGGIASWGERQGGAWN